LGLEHLSPNQPALNWIEENAMADGTEERQEQEQRRQWEQERNREDRLEHYPADQWQPERRES
jgi:hypothetical protein